MGKKKKKKRQGALPPKGQQFSVDPEQVMAVLRVRSQYDKELQLNIEAAQWEAASTTEQAKRMELEAKLLEMVKEREEEE